MISNVYTFDVACVRHNDENIQFCSLTGEVYVSFTSLIYIFIYLILQYHSYSNIYISKNCLMLEYDKQDVNDKNWKEKYDQFGMK